MRTRTAPSLIVLCTLLSISAAAQTATQQAAPKAAVVSATAGVSPTAAKEVQSIGEVPFGEGSGIYDPYENRVLGKQRWEKDSFMRFLYHTPGTRHELPVVYGPLKEGC